MLEGHRGWASEGPPRRAGNAAIEEALAAYMKAARGAVSPNTEHALRADVKVFASWCRQREKETFPASPETLAAFVEEMTDTKTPATVRRYVSSIATLHKGLSHGNPRENATVRFALQRMHRRRGRRQAQVRGLTWPLRNRMLEGAGGRLIDSRNRALLAVAYDTLLRRSELVAVEAADVLEEIDGSATLLVRCGKTDQEGRGAVLYLARDTMLLVKLWLNGSGIKEGRLFRAVLKGGRVRGDLHPAQVPRIYKRMAMDAGLGAEIAESLAGHSTRIGAAQDMIACGIELPAILQSGRWTTTRMVQRYGERLLASRSGAAQLAERQRR